MRQFAGHDAVRPLAAMALGVVLCMATPAVAAAKETIAMLPTSGGAPIDSRAALDVAVRKALGKNAGLKVLGAKETGSAMSTLIDLNSEVCENEDIPCLSKLGILADVHALLIVEADGDRTLNVKLILIDVEEGRLVRSVDGPVRANAMGDVDGLVDRIFNGASEVPRIIDSSTSTTPGVLDGPTPQLPDTNGPIDETRFTDLQFAGATIAGVGGGLAAVGLLGALTCEAIFWTGTGPADTRKNVVAPLGSAMWVGAVVGGVAAGLGGGLFVAGAPDTGSRTLE